MPDLIEHTPTPLTAPETQSKSTFSTIAYHAVAILAWAYVIMKLFMFDGDVYLLNSINEKWTWVLDYKFFVLVAAITMSFLFFKKGHILLFILFMAFYPLIVVFYYIPKYIFKTKNWMVLVATCNALIATFTNFRVKFALFSLTVISIAIIYASLDWLLLAIAAATLVALNYIEYGVKIVSAFKTSKVMKIYGKIPEMGDQFIKKQAELEIVREFSVANMDDKQLVVYRNALQLSLIANRVCLFSATILRDYKRSGFPAVSGALATLSLFVFTVVTFSAVNMAIFKMNIDAFSYDQSSFPTWFTFFITALIRWFLYLLEN